MKKKVLFTFLGLITVALGILLFKAFTFSSKQKYISALAEPSAVSPLNGFGFEKIDEAIKQSGRSSISAPFFIIGATDSRHFGDISKNIIKFSPMIDPIGFDGIDERISLESYRCSLWFYELLVRSL